MYNYLEEMVDDIINYTLMTYKDEDFHDPDFWEDRLHDELWVESCITGNGVAGPYFSSATKAREAVFGNPHNIDLLCDALEEFGNEPEDYKRAMKDANYADTTIRCYLLSQAIEMAKERMEF